MSALGLLLFAVSASGVGDAGSEAAVPGLAPKSAVASADHAEVRLGEPFVVKVVVKHDPKEQWSIAPDQGYAPFNLRGQTRHPSKEGPLAVDEYDLTLALFQLGAHPVPDLKLQGNAAGQPAATFTLPGPVIKGVAPEIEKDKEKRDILGPVAVQITTLRPLLWAGGALLLALLIFLAVRFWRRRPKHDLTAFVPTRPPDEVALEALAALEAQGLPAKGRFKLFHLDLSEILRRYFGDRYRIRALDMTSSELLEALGRIPTPGLSMAELSWVCGQGDLAKFAKGEPTADDCKQALALVRHMVTQTRQPETSPAAGAATAVQGVGT